jgi:predicted NBD/HSP70 family sugar kinase
MADSKDLRRLNQKKILKALLGRGVATRAELARAVELSQPTAGAIVDDLLTAQILENSDAPTAANGNDELGKQAETWASARVGRPGRLVRLDRTRQRFLAIELGVRHTRVARVPVGVTDSDWEFTVPTPASSGEWANRLTKAVKRRLDESIEAVLLSVPGVVDERNSRVLLCPNLRWVERMNLPDLLRGTFGVPTLLVQEIRALALGELAVNTNCEDFLLVDIGDGVGGAAVIGGRLFESPLPLSGELGHDPVWGNQRTCGCGAVGCVETLVARRGLLASFDASNPKGPRTWAGLLRHIQENGVPRWLTDGLDALGIAIAGALNVLGVHRVIVTGILNELPAPVMAGLSRVVMKGAIWARFGEVTCETAPRRRMAGLVSAAIDRILLPDVDDIAGKEFRLTGNAG